MKTALEYNLALRVRSATRWVEGQQGMLPDDGDGAVDGFGRAMLVRTGALPSPYTGAEGVAGTTIDQQPTGANVAGVAVLIKDLNGGKLAANTTYSARLGGYLTGKALYFVEAAAGTNIIGEGIVYGAVDSTTGLILGDDGFTYSFGNAGYWWSTQFRISCKFRKRGTRRAGYDEVEVFYIESKLVFSKAKLASNGFIELFKFGIIGSGEQAFAYAVDPMKLAAHMTNDRRVGQGSGPIFSVAVYFSFYEPYGQIVSVASATWPVVGYDPIMLVGYAPFWAGNLTSPMASTLGAPLGSPLGG